MTFVAGGASVLYSNVESVSELKFAVRGALAPIQRLQLSKMWIDW